MTYWMCNHAYFSISMQPLRLAEAVRRYLDGLMPREGKILGPILLCSVLQGYLGLTNAKLLDVNIGILSFNAEKEN